MQIKFCKSCLSELPQAAGCVFGLDQPGKSGVGQSPRAHRYRRVERAVIIKIKEGVTGSLWTSVTGQALGARRSCFPTRLFGLVIDLR